MRGHSSRKMTNDIALFIRSCDAELSHPGAAQVHRDDEEPYYTVRVHATGRERQTDANHLVRTLPHEPPASAAHSDETKG